MEHRLVIFSFRIFPKAFARRKYFFVSNRALKQWFNGLEWFWDLKIFVFALVMMVNREAYSQPGMTAAAHPRAYCLDAQGDDHNDGSKLHPWKTIHRLNAARLHPGDSVLFQGGQEFAGTLQLDSSKSGTAAHCLWLGSYGNGYPLIDSGDSSALVLYLAKYITINNLRLKGAGRKEGNIKNGIAMIQCGHIRLENLDITGFQKSGLFIYASTEVEATSIFVHENGSAGITVEGEEGKKSSRNIRISNCRADDNPGDPTNLTNHSGNGIVVGHCTHVIIDHCSATNNGWDMPRIGNGPVGIWCYEADSVIIQNCLSFHNKTSVGGADGGGFDLDGGVTNSIIQYCMSYGNQGSGYCMFQYWGASPWYHNIIRYNISENDGTVSDSRAGMYVWNSSGDKDQFYDCVCYNNTVFNAVEAALSFSDKSERKDFRFFNNIFVGKDSLIRGNKGLDVFLGNDWWSISGGFNADGIRDFKTWATKYNREMQSGNMAGYNLDPGFVNPGHCNLTSAAALRSFETYMLPQGSPLVDGGIDLAGVYHVHTGNFDFHRQHALPKTIGALSAKTTK